MINLLNKERREYEVFSIFYQFFIKKEKIYVIGELCALCINDKKLLWKENFSEIIDIDYITDDLLVLKDFNGIEIKIDLNLMETLD